MNRTSYIPITESTTDGKVILKGYIKEETTEDRILLDEPKVFDTYKEMMKYLKSEGK